MSNQIGNHLTDFFADAVKEQGGSKELSTFYSREHVQWLREKALTASEESAPWRNDDLERVCSTVGIDLEAMKEDPSLLDRFPTREELRCKLAEFLHTLFLRFPRSSDYMTRLVRNLAPEYSGDPVRLAILKKFFLGAGLRCDTVPTESVAAWCEERLTEKERAAFQEASEPERVRLLAEKLEEALFLIPREVRLTGAERLELMLGQMKKWREDKDLAFGDLELRPETEAAILALCGGEEAGPAPGGAGTGLLSLLLEGLRTGRLSGEDPALREAVDAAEQDLRVRAGSVFRGSGNKRVPLWESYKEARRYALRKKRAKTDWSLLDWCDDLASGYFRSNGETKLLLYYFAVMFGMTVDPEDPERDIVKNLFEDYYSDNMTRYLDKAYQQQDWATLYEKEPTGEGINYKNYVEALFVYFLKRDDLVMTPGEKLDSISRIAGECVDRARSLGRGPALPDEEDEPYTTLDYRNTHLEKMLLLEPEELAEYLVHHFIIFSPENRSAARITVNAGEYGAYLGVADLMSEMSESFPSMGVMEMMPSFGLNDEVSREEREYVTSTEFKSGFPDFLRACYPEDADFLRIIDVMETRLQDDTSGFHTQNRRLMLAILHVLCRRTDENTSIGIKALETALNAMKLDVKRPWITSCVKLMNGIGLDIRRVRDNFSLFSRSYSDADLNLLVKTASDFSWIKGDDLLLKLLLEKQWPKKRITRTDLLSIHLNYYIFSKLMYGSGKDAETLGSFPNVLSDYRTSADHYLKAGRFQPISEKNLLDVFIVLMIYYYLVESV